MSEFVGNGWVENVVWENKKYRVTYDINDEITNPEQLPRELIKLLDKGGREI